MGSEILSPFSFYGGKKKMAPLICEMLDYKNTELYIEPFGGACRVLLNKPRHLAEIYNDYGYGLCTFFKTMGNPDLSSEVIRRLYEIEPDADVFYEMQKYKIRNEQDLTDWMRWEAKKFAYECIKRYQTEELKKLHRHICGSEYADAIEAMKTIICSGCLQKEDIAEMQRFLEVYSQYWEIVKTSYWEAYFEAYRKNKEKNIDLGSDAKWRKHCHKEALESLKEYISDYDPSNGSTHDNVEMAVATFITYFFSRDGMGHDFSSAKLKTADAYYSSLDKLEDIAHRMEGVAVTQTGAVDYILQYKNNPKVMMYLDPSYLNNEKKDLGACVYNRSSDYKEHKGYAKMICSSKAKILLSNYDVEPYSKYLDEAHGWKKVYFQTTTSVGNKKGNKRTEVLWYNY